MPDIDAITEENVVNKEVTTEVLEIKKEKKKSRKGKEVEPLNLQEGTSLDTDEKKKRKKERNKERAENVEDLENDGKPNKRKKRKREHLDDDHEILEIGRAHV